LHPPPLRREPLAPRRRPGAAPRGPRRLPRASGSGAVFGTIAHEPWLWSRRLGKSTDRASHLSMKTPISHPVVNHVLARHGIPPKYVTTFDASTVLQRALAAFLRGEDFEAGAALPWGGPLGRATLCALPNSG